MTWTPPRDYWSVDTGSGYYHVSEDEARKVIVALNKGDWMVCFDDIYGSPTVLVLARVESVYEMTAEQRRRMREMGKMWDSEDDGEEAWR